MIQVIKKNKFFKATLLYTVGEFLVRGLSFLTLPIFTALLSVNDYGNLSLYNTWVAFIGVFATLSFAPSILRGKQEFKEEYESFFKTIVLFLIFLNILLMTLSFFLSYRIGSKVYFLAHLTCVINLIPTFYIEKLKANHQVKQVLALSLLRAFITISVGIMLIFKLDGSYLGRVYSNIIVNSFLSLLLYYKFLKGGEYNKKFLRFSLAFSLPLIPHYLSHILLGQADRLLISKYYSSFEVGLYSFSYNIGMIGFFIWIASNSAWLPRFYKEYDKKFEGTLKKVDYYIVFFTYIITGVMYISPEIVQIMGRKSEYIVTTNLVSIIIVSYYLHFLYTFLVNIQMAYKKNIMISLGTILAGAINVILNILLLPKYGYQIAGITTIISHPIFHN